MIRLTKRSLIGLFIGTPLWLISPQISTLYILAALAFFSLELALLPKKSKLTIKRILPQHFVIGSLSLVRWKVTNGKGILKDCFPHKQYRIQITSETTEESYLPVERGHFSLNAPSLTLRGTLGLIDREYFFDNIEQIKIFPNSRTSKNFFPIAFNRQNSTSPLTQKIRQQEGEFESLRPYIYGEDLRNVEWKISAKKGEMICKNREIENDRHIAVLIDCGRNTAEKMGKYSLLDHSITATAQLCRLIQSKHDTFSLYAFSNKIEASLPKTDRKTMIRKTLDTIYQLKPQLIESDYWKVVGEVMHKLNKRSLIILFSHVLDKPGSLGLVNNLAKASKKHLVLCVIMKDQKLHETTHHKDPFFQASACHLLLERKRAIKNMKAKGIHVLEANTEQYVSEVIQTYLSIREKI